MTTQEFIKTANRSELLSIIEKANLYPRAIFIALKMGSSDENLRSIVKKEFAKVTEKEVKTAPKKAEKVNNKSANTATKTSKMRITVKSVKSTPKTNVKSAKVEKTSQKPAVQKVKTAAKNSQKMTKVETKTDASIDKIKFVSNAELSELKTIANWDLRFSSVDFNAEHLVRAQFIAILMGANVEETKTVKMETKPTPVKQAANEVEAPVKPKAKAKAKTAQKTGLPSKTEIAETFVLNCAKAKNEEDQWYTIQELTDEVCEVYGEEARPSTTKSMSAFNTKMREKGYEIEKDATLFVDDNGKAIVAFKITNA